MVDRVIHPSLWSMIALVLKRYSTDVKHMLEHEIELNGRPKEKDHRKTIAFQMLCGIEDDISL